MKHTKQSGFTLIELMIAVVIVGLLAAIALPAYNDQIRKSRRADGKALAMLLAQQQERCYSLYFSYDNANCPAESGHTSDEGYYTGAITDNTNTFTVTVTATGAQLSDTDCRTFTITHTGAKAAANSGGTANTECW